MKYKPASELKHTTQNPHLQKLIDKNAAFLTSLERNPMYDAVITELHGRKIKINGQWLIDWASCNYLGFDLDREIMDAIPPMVQKWGTHPSWSRMLGSPALYEEIENKITELLGAQDTLAFPNITMMNEHTIFVLSEGGEIFLDKYSHRTLYDGAAIARAHGAKLTYYKSDDLEYLELQLKISKAHKKLILIDGVYSMHGKYADIPKVAEIARKYDALLYIDDAHGMGIVGERGPDELSPYGKKGNCIVKYFNESYDNIVLVSGLSKSYSTYFAFMCCSPELKRYLKSVIAPYIYTGPVPVASLATALKGLEVNEKRGDKVRADLYRKSKLLNDAIKEMGIRNDNTTDFPIFNIYLEDANDLDAVADYLFENNTYVTLAPYPMVAKRDVGFRIQVTAANTVDEVEFLIQVLKNLSERFSLQAA